jgi:hypothetical protein
MRIGLSRTIAALSLVCAAIAAPASLAPSVLHAGALPAAIDDVEFWRLIIELSEPAGAFQQQLMSNEDSAQVVIPALKETTSRGGVYIGVGPEQNFTYIAATQPGLAFVLDIRRDNMLQHLMYKALFELSPARADFLSRLVSRRRPPGLGADASVTALFDAYLTAAPDDGLFDDTLRAVMEGLTSRHGFPLTDADRAGITRIMLAFRKAGPHDLKGSGDKNLTYVQAMTATDLMGVHQGFLASEERFGIVRTLAARNLIVPVVGDFAGDRSLAGIGRYLAGRGASVNVFYVSNVERYLFQQPDRSRRFYANVAALPLDSSSTFVRSVTRDISQRLGFPLPDGSGNWWTVLAPIRPCLDAAASGRLESYPQLFESPR